MEESRRNKKAKQELSTTPPLDNEKDIPEGKRIYVDSVKNLIKPAQVEHQNLRDTYNKLDMLVEEVVSRNEWLLNSKFKVRLEEAIYELQQMTLKLAQLNHEVENNPEVTHLNSEMDKYNSQAETLRRFAGQLKGQHTFYKEIAYQEQESITALKTELKTLSKENLRMSYKIEEIQRHQVDQISASTSRLPPISFRSKGAQSVYFHSLTPDQQLASEQYIQEVEDFKRNLKQIKEENYKLTTLQGAFLCEQRKAEEFFQDCLEVSRRELLKTQVMPQRSTRGLAGSLYFELIYSRLQTQRSHKTLQRSSLQDRDSQNVVYNTVQNLIRSARANSRKQQISNLGIKWSDFSSFNGLQIIGLLNIREDVLRDLHKEVFPANLLHLHSDEALSASSTRVLRKSKSLLNKLTVGTKLPEDLKPHKSRIAKELRAKHA
jgi:hypothetical protein